MGFWAAQFLVTVDSGTTVSTPRLYLEGTNHCIALGECFVAERLAGAHRVPIGSTSAGRIRRECYLVKFDGGGRLDFGTDSRSPLVRGCVGAADCRSNLTEGPLTDEKINASGMALPSTRKLRIPRICFPAATVAPAVISPWIRSWRGASSLSPTCKRNPPNGKVAVIPLVFMASTATANSCASNSAATVVADGESETDMAEMIQSPAGADVPMPNTSGGFTS